MIKQFLQNWLGISKNKADIHNLDGDLMCILERDPTLTAIVKEEELPPDNPLIADETYEMLADYEQTDGWYVIWSTGFSGPFPSEKEAKEYRNKNDLEYRAFCDVARLKKYPFKKKGE